MAESKIKEEKLREDIKKILEHINDLNKHIDESGTEIEETGEGVEEIKERVEDIGTEIEETGEDVEEIKEDIEEIKENIGALSKTISKGKQLVSRVATSVLPDKFAFKDIAQQIVGATIFSAPFAVTEEVWNLAKNLDMWHVISLIIITLTFDILLFYYAKYQKVEGKRFLNVFPARIFSIIIVTYSTSFIILTVLGVIGGKYL